ncbi:MAG: DUF624 domain-containing protein [Eubacterium sp.]|nr:DUF624 domain-containing protein [Eubacterium sp.]
MKMFNIDGPIYKFMSALTNMFLLNLCWIVGTVIGLGTTIGVSTVAAFDVGLKMAENKEGYVVKQFIKAYKKNFKPAFPLGIMAVVAAYTVYLDFELFNKIKDATILLPMWGFLTGAVFFCCFVYAFPLCARYQNSLKNTIQNSFRIAMRYIGRTVLLLIVLVILNVTFIWNYTLIFIGLIIGPASYILTVSMFAMPVFRKIEKQNTEDGVETYDNPDDNSEV